MDLVYVITPAILIFVVLAAVWLDRWSVPVILVALGGGMFFGSDILQWVHFDNATLANQVANFALVFILFQGGFGIKRSDFQAVALPAGGLATWGVLLTAAITFLVLWGALRWPLEKAMLLAKWGMMDPLNIQELIARGPKSRAEELRLELYDKVNALGIGAQGQPSWGTMIASARLRLWQGMWWELAAVTVAIFAVVLAFNLLGDILRDALDPRLRVATD